MTTNLMDQVKELRALTGCGIVDCKEALSEADGNIDEAVNLLRKQGKASAATKADRSTAEGVVGVYLHGNHKLGVLVTVQCETDFVAKNGKFQDLAKNIAMHIAAAEPVAVSPDDISAELIAAEETLAKEQATSSGKPKDIQSKMIEGKISKFKAERALLTQPYVKDPNQTINDLINAAIQELGENILVKEFHRLSI